MARISCRGLTRTFRKGEREITPLCGLDLDIEAGRFTALMGPSGSGKTTLLNLIAGIDRPTSGSLRVDGLDLATLDRRQLAEWRAGHIGYVFQLYNLVSVLTAYENVELPLLLQSMNASERHRRVVTALELTGIAHRHDHFPNQLSGGEEQRVAIARAIVADPAIIVADEPTGDLDSQSAVMVMDLLCRLNVEMNKTLIMVTHDPRCAARSDQQYYLEKGKLISHGEEVGHRPASRGEEAE